MTTTSSPAIPGMARPIPAGDRRQILLSTSDRSSRILEIGPAHAPIAPKREGWRTAVIDTCDAEALRRKFAGTGSDLDAIEPVDFILTSTLTAAVPEALHGSFDTLIASHVIEHIPDMVGFFAAAGRLLKPDGAIALAVPDYRYCFDCFKSPTTTAEIVGAHLAGATRHRRATLFEHVAYEVGAHSVADTLVPAGAFTWGQAPVGDFFFTRTLPEAWALANQADEQGGTYFDSHVWKLTPARLQLIMLELGQLGIVDWHIEAIGGTQGFEFLVILRRGAAPAMATPSLNALRLALLQTTLRETGEQIACALGATPTPLAALTAVIAEQHQAMDSQAARLQEMAAMLERQMAQLQAIAEVAAWQRRLLAPLRAVWRLLRRRGPLPNA